MTTIVGLDLSLTATGLWRDTDDCHLIGTKKQGMERLAYLRQTIIGVVSTADLVVIEGYSLGNTRASQSHAAGELGGLVRWSLHIQGIPYVDVPPASLKKFATGKGNANKDAMVATAVRAGCPADDNNLCDAWWLRQLGMYGIAYDRDDLACSSIAVPVTGYRNEVAAKIEWPALDGKA